eukprot:CAMPEP_0172471626 /NCGR_PEP_ID=MMETSP1065-20121228/67914_1 /TAXON_ID=265537 /ORGANISM="Amphiprora paludosa, Strain CCMP125" /LENGTH=378 /DNA_ID=CAMNT_0013229731 /DNA_START=23 /DNA_END=1156 /DNA_ORIENTATION=-
MILRLSLFAVALPAYVQGQSYNLTCCEGPECEMKNVVKIIPDGTPSLSPVQSSSFPTTNPTSQPVPAPTPTGGGGSGSGGIATDFPTTSLPTTAAPITSSPTTVAPITSSPTTAAPITSSPTTAAPITSSPTTAAPITSSPTTAAPTTRAPATSAPTGTAPVTGAPTTMAPTTTAPTTSAPTTSAPTTNEPTTAAPNTNAPTASSPVTSEPTTQCVLLDDQDFSNGLGGWSLGSNANLVEDYDWSIRIKDKDQSSSHMTQHFDQSDIGNMDTHSEITVTFDFCAESMESTDKFYMQFAIDDGDFYNFAEYESGKDFSNGGCMYGLTESFFLPGGSKSVDIRFQGGDMSNQDRVFISKVKVDWCRATCSDKPLDICVAI